MSRDTPPVVVDARALSRTFGALVAVREVSFQVYRGEIFGLLGPNGAGKSTTLRMLCGILTPTGGSATVAGFDVERDPEAVKQHIGYMTQRFSLYDDLTAEENLRFYAGIYGVSRRERPARVEAALARHRLTARRHQLAGTLSGGWKQRLALVCATIHEPPLLFLDEPTAGVDPVSRRQFWAQIHAIAAAGTTIIVTTHYMDEAQRCHRLGFLFSGHMLDVGTPEEVVARRNLAVVWVLAPDGPAIDALRARPEVDDIAPYGDRLRVILRGAPAPEQLVGDVLAQAGVHAQGLRLDTPSVEDAFIATVHLEQGAGATPEPAEARP